ncbi:MAG: 2Fe-2S iron-sulfur cluster binding domain-containing protein [Nitrospirae bacterium]|nr:2Fe-2S iron-sulfur cluster binding domain-containing protein [Nitrospirota bacterium]
METRLSDSKNSGETEHNKVKITFLPQNTSVEGEEGKSILDIALEHDVEIDHNCGGNGACTTCHVIVKEGMNNLSEAEDGENDMLDNAVGVTLTSRLGCQAHVYGDVVVEIPGK